jgi:hypothetical protein
VVVLLAALGLTIWQVIEISLSNESILDLASGGPGGHIHPNNTNGTGTNSGATAQTVAKRVTVMAFGIVSAILVALCSFILPYFFTSSNGLNAFNV